MTISISKFQQTSKITFYFNFNSLSWKTKIFQTDKPSAHGEQYPSQPLSDAKNMGLVRKRFENFNLLKLFQTFTLTLACICSRTVHFILLFFHYSFILRLKNLNEITSPTLKRVLIFRLIFPHFFRPVLSGTGKNVKNASSPRNNILIATLFHPRNRAEKKEWKRDFEVKLPNMKKASFFMLEKFLSWLHGSRKRAG